MITQNLGKIAITPKGQWVAGSYERLDMVTNAGSSYISLKDNNVSALNTADWMLVAGKGDAFEYSDFTPEQIATLQQPATDIASTVSQAEGLRVTAESGRVTAEGLRVTAESNRSGAELLRSGAESDRSGAELLRAGAEDTREMNEYNREQAEALRVQAEIDRQTNTGTAIQNAETATQNAETATQNANDAKDLALEVANHPDIIQNDYWYKWNTTTNVYENTNIKAKGEPGATALVKQVTGASETDVMSQKAVSDGLALKLEKNTFYKTGKNILNPATITTGYFVNQLTGILNASVGYDTSDYIQVSPNTTYSRTYNSRYACYDVNKTFISGATTGQITTPANCYYVRWSFNTGTVNTQQFELGASITSYEAYYNLFNTDLLPKKDFIEKIMLKSNSVDITKTDFIVIGKNKFNKSTVTNGYYVNYINGTLSANSTYSASDYISVIPNTEYTRGSIGQLAFYDINKVFISGIAVGSTFTTPANCYYLRLTVETISLNTYQLELGTTKTQFQEFGYIINGGLYQQQTLTTTDEVLMLNVAPVIPALVGKELNIYFNNILCADDINNYKINVVCNKGVQQVERFTYIPLAGDVGDIPISIEVYQKATLVASVSSIIRVSALAKGTGQTLKVNIIGDSTTANGYMVDELANVFGTDAMHISLIGTQGVSPNFHEGWSGRTTNWMYSDVTSPFVYSGVFNYANYLSSKSLATPDIVIINLGINDMFSFGDDTSVLSAINTMITQYDAMIANIRTVNANMKFGICVTIPSGNQDAFGSYGASQTGWRYNRNNRILGNALINYYKGKEAQNIYLVPININLDTVSNMQFDSAKPVNSRNPLTIQRQTNGVHPGIYGYYQIADVIYYWIKSLGT